MSDPMTNVEIEDVLSSIRRLVSASSLPEKETSERPQGLAGTNEQEKAMDKLVLTQALRIPDPAEADLGSSLGYGDDTLDTREALVDGLDEEIVQITDAKQATLQEVSQLTEQLTVLSDAAAKDAVVESLREALFKRPVPDQDAAELPASEEAAPAASARARTLEEKIAELEAMIGHNAADIEADQTVAPSSEAEAEFAAAWNSAPAEEPAPEAQSAPEMPAEPVEEDVAEVAEAPVEPAPKPALNAPHVLFEHRKPVQTGERKEPPLKAEFPKLRSVPAPEGAVDPDVLRRIVSDILHEELRGALGERITRNVRKMVRREIQRALMARELD